MEVIPRKKIIIYWFGYIYLLMKLNILMKFFRKFLVICNILWRYKVTCPVLHCFHPCPDPFSCPSCPHPWPYLFSSLSVLIPVQFLSLSILITVQSVADQFGMAVREYRETGKIHKYRNLLYIYPKEFPRDSSGNSLSIPQVVPKGNPEGFRSEFPRDSPGKP